MALTHNPELPGVPSVLDLVKDPKDRQVYEFLFARQEAGRPFVAPPEVPADRVNALRTAFVAAMKEPELLKDAEKLGLDLAILDGDELTGLIRDMMSTPVELVGKMESLLK